MKLSSLLSRFSEPETLKMAKLGRELRAKGVDVIDLSLGEPDFDTPKHIKEAAKKAVDDNYSHYTPVPGYLDVREAVCVKLKRDNNLEYKPENIVLSTGAKQSLANVILATVDQGDEVIIPAPFWVTYSELVKIAGGVPVILTTTMENKYKITGAELEAAITPKTKVFLFSSPCNPSGSVYSYDELKSLADVFAKHPEIFIISDEIYEYINFVGKHESIAQFDAIKDQVIIVNGLSKGYAMTGYRLGYIAANVDVAKGCEKLQGQFTSGTNAVTQRATIDALVGDQTPTHEMTKEFERRKKRVMELVSEVPGWKLAEPDGAFYVFPQVSFYFGKSDGTNVINDADDLCMYLLNVAHVSTVTGRAFGTPDCIRLSFANSLEKIEEAYKRIKEALAKLK
ncbi:pyridoxal phosphate-dependent aminotransferase [Lacibacter sp.]|uniref:pyridoxal phosphate-dependent aminotransferase n=1 Tax=Lacibacter sp. TaxID=1915409 RepID=UPI002B4B67D2|nr:pyridoxal phosphate-dependent aminotransferase [Lacibacter sp.]HLP38828.1 pyridoxal phosphate-dependent aminotransferase [Lacibacter sp.]